MRQRQSAEARSRPARIRWPALPSTEGCPPNRSTEFALHWSAHDVRHRGTGAKHFHRNVVGDFNLTYEVLALVSEPGLTVTIHVVEPASPSSEALRPRASWAASTLPADADVHP